MRIILWQSQGQAIQCLAGVNGKITRHENLPFVSVIRPIGESGECDFACWRGKAIKPFAHYRTKTLAQAEQYITSVRDRIAACEQAKRELMTEDRKLRAAMNAADHWKVGDIVVHSWGYDQTNIDFFQIVEVKKKSVIIRRIKHTTSETGVMSGDTIPFPSEFCGEAMLKHLDASGQIEYSRWDGKPKHCSWYA